MNDGLFTVAELQTELHRLMQVHATLVTLKPMIVNDQGQQLWKRAAQELEDRTLKVRLALAITEAPHRIQESMPTTYVRQVTRRKNQ